jgi:GNAT superfamily N-acetyltransferase
MIGVEPHAQGRGLGGALMKHAVERCDADGVLAYLESSNPRNLALYERHGFERVGEIQIGTGPLVTGALIEPCGTVASFTREYPARRDPRQRRRP